MKSQHSLHYDLSCHKAMLYANKLITLLSQQLQKMMQILTDVY